MIASILAVLILVSATLGGVLQAEPVAVQIQDRDRDAYCLGDDPDPHPVGERLADEYDWPYDDIKTWYCDGYGMGEIENALWAAAHTDDMEPQDVLDLHDTLGRGWGQVWQELGLIGGGPDTSTERPGPYADGEGPEDETPAGVQIQDRDRDAYCLEIDETDPNPGVQQIADDYGIPYMELIVWFCGVEGDDGEVYSYGIGEIENAVWTSLRADPPVTIEEVFALHEDLDGWGRVWLELGLVGKAATSDVRPGKGDYCVGAADHPAAERLAEEYDVEYDDIMTWFCEESYSFGEIKVALEVGEQLELDPEELLGSKDDLGAWAKVWQELGFTGRPWDVTGRGKQGGDAVGPAGPGNPEKPKPATPAKPTTPSKPTTPKPAAPAKPASPGQPAQPGNQGSTGQKNG